ncbi:Uncharacterised protein [Bifidobacterium bifidum]|nr:Uncharacterised protein [Bifidobacterium bifidum]
MKPAEKLKPAIHWKDAAMNTDRAVSSACTTYSGKAANMKENSRGSVTPVRKAARPPASIREPTVRRFSGLAQR